MSRSCCKILFLLTITGATFAVSGCKTTEPGHGKSSVNVFGIVETKEKSYEKPSGNTFELSSDSLPGNNDKSGRQVKLLWGLITYTDY